MPGDTRCARVTVTGRDSALDRVRRGRSCDTTAAKQAHGPDGAPAPWGSEGRQMDDTTELERRITAALGRIRRQIDGVSAPAAATPRDSPAGDTPVEDDTSLRAQLEEERQVNAQLEERVRALKDRQDTRVAQLESGLDKGRKRISDLDAGLQRLQTANADLRAVAADMRRSLTEGVADPELVNRSALAELDALQAARDADRAEFDAVIAELEPLIGGDD